MATPIGTYRDGGAAAEERFAWASKFANVPLDMPLFATGEEERHRNLGALLHQISKLSDKPPCKYPSDVLSGTPREKQSGRGGAGGAGFNMDLTESWRSAVKCDAAAASGRGATATSGHALTGSWEDALPSESNLSPGGLLPFRGDTLEHILAQNLRAA